MTPTELSGPPEPNYWGILRGIESRIELDELLTDELARKQWRSEMSVFWKECRKQIGYDQQFDMPGILMLESHAESWAMARGETIYGYIIDLLEFFKEMTESASRKPAKKTQ